MGNPKEAKAKQEIIKQKQVNKKQKKQYVADPLLLRRCQQRLSILHNSHFK